MGLNVNVNGDVISHVVDLVKKRWFFAFRSLQLLDIFFVIIVVQIVFILVYVRRFQQSMGTTHCR